MATKFTDLTISDYSTRSVVVQGETRKYKEDLKKLGGKFNSKLRDGPGWIFPKTMEKDILDFINGGQRLVTPEEEKEGEVRTLQRSQEWENNPSNNEINKKLDMIINMIKKLDEKISKLSETEEAIIVEQEDSSSSDDEEAPRKRLMK